MPNPRSSSFPRSPMPHRPAQPGPRRGREGGAVWWILAPLAAVALLSTALEFQVYEQVCLNVTCWSTVLPRVMRDMLPAVIVITTLACIAANFARAVYKLRTLDDAFGFVLQQMLGRPPSHSGIVVEESQISISDQDRLARLGGPGQLTIHSDSAVVLERAGKLTHVFKKDDDDCRLDAFEKVWNSVALRPRRQECKAIAMSQDGIPLICQVDVAFQVSGGAPGSSSATPKAILRAATCQLVNKTGQAKDSRVLDWAERAIAEVTEEALRDILALYSLDDLIEPVEPGKNNGRARIARELKEALRPSFSELGLELTKLELGDIAVADETLQRRIEAWQLFWKHSIGQSQAHGQADYSEAARRQAQADIIVAITQASQSLKQPGAMTSSQLALLRLLEASSSLFSSL